jgi:pimeloyl-ACP methyl ester carboxylesterase
MKKRHLLWAFGGAVGGVAAVKMLARAATVSWEDVADRIPHAEHSRFVNVDGARVHYQEFGNTADPPVVLIHGFTASVYVWKTVAPLLTENGFRVIALDLLGFGYSEKPSWFDYSIQSQARMVSRFMNRIGVGSATIVGSSYGGAVAAMLTLDYPEAVEKLVLVDSVINDDQKSHPILKLISLPGVGEFFAPLIADTKWFVRSRMRNTIARANHRLITNERIEAIRRPLHAADGHRSLLATSRNWRATRIEQDAHLIKQPTLIIWGEDDTLVPITNAHKLHENIANSRLIVLKNCGHIPQEECPELFADIVVEFFHSRLN